MDSKGTSFIKRAENFNEFEDLSNDLKSHKDIEDVAKVNEEIKMNISKDDEHLVGVTLEKMKVGTPCKLAFETKEHIISWGIIFDSEVEGDNVKVAVDVVMDGDCAIPITTKKGIYKMSQEVASHILWPQHLIECGEFTKDMITFAPTPIQTASVALRCLL
ncbi:hypothetical protein E5676_scaffold546G002260 [Cucumis melo var. makuwa]|uniref:DUF8039 domain-containing protein n=1 Tax=Cucumis melo var. makuwa TaxID=1194695 RepID=A0A5D3BC67_CUCMM|nr:hypothetical protein E6C27_scaffold37G001330 [Cucumis melo var. makuwa]TYJ96564.1 hypothetical protein E5676_scaffold546G002260 [Cucumis melo var. makuwa]